MQDRRFLPLVPIVESDAMVNKGEKTTQFTASLLDELLS